jgi:hypothetical protein
MQTVHDVRYRLLCELGLITIFGSVESTEETLPTSAMCWLRKKHE